MTDSSDIQHRCPKRSSRNRFSFRLPTDAVPGIWLKSAWCTADVSVSGQGLTSPVSTAPNECRNWDSRVVGIPLRGLDKFSLTPGQWRSLYGFCQMRQSVWFRCFTRQLQGPKLNCALVEVEQVTCKVGIETGDV